MMLAGSSGKFIRALPSAVLATIGASLLPPSIEATDAETLGVRASTTQMAPAST